MLVNTAWKKGGIQVIIDISLLLLCDWFRKCISMCMFPLLHPESLAALELWTQTIHNTTVGAVLHLQVSQCHVFYL